MNLSEESIRGAPHNPGSGGWPTIRYFNKETGLDGGTYVKKTSKGMCEELGDKDLMIDYVEDYGKTALCNPANSKKCTQKERDYLKKIKAMDADAQEEQKVRLDGMMKKDMKDDLKEWVLRRRRLLAKVTAGSDEL